MTHTNFLKKNYNHMKKLFFTFLIGFGFISMLHAQLLPSVQFGLKAGVNLAKLSETGNLSSENKAGYLGGIWARFGAVGIHFQPELYLTGKSTELKENSSGQIDKINFTSVDVPLLVGLKFGALGFGGRLNTGPAVSFIVNKDQSLGAAASNAARLNYKDQAFAWQFGAGVDIKKISFDLRYEAGLSKLSTEGYPDTKLNLYSLSMAYRLF